MAAYVSVITVTLNRDSLERACASVDAQTSQDWHHYVIGDGVLPRERRHRSRTVIGFSRALGAEEPGLNMPNGTPNPLQRWALTHLQLGAYVCFLDDDNEYFPDFLECMTHALDTSPTCGIALCRVIDRRYGQSIDGFPELGRCDNSGFLARRDAAKSVPFPYAGTTREVVQDVEFIQQLATKSGWTRVDRDLVVFGSAPDIPPRRGRPRIVTSWEGPLKAVRQMRSGEFDLARSKLEEFVAADELDAWSLWHLAEARHRSHDIDGARVAWTRWLAIAEKANDDHDNIAFLISVARLAVKRTDWREGLVPAIASATRRVEAGPQTAGPLLDRSTYKMLIGDTSGALADLALVVSCRVRAGELDDACATFALLKIIGCDRGACTEAIALIRSFQ